MDKMNNESKQSNNKSLEKANKKKQSNTVLELVDAILKNIKIKTSYDSNLSVFNMKNVINKSKSVFSVMNATTTDAESKPHQDTSELSNTENQNHTGNVINTNNTKVEDNKSKSKQSSSEQFERMDRKSESVLNLHDVPEKNTKIKPFSNSTADLSTEVVKNEFEKLSKSDDAVVEKANSPSQGSLANTGTTNTKNQPERVLKLDDALTESTKYKLIQDSTEDIPKTDIKNRSSEVINLDNFPVRNNKSKPSQDSPSDLSKFDFKNRFNVDLKSDVTSEAKAESKPNQGSAAVINTTEPKNISEAKIKPGFSPETNAESKLIQDSLVSVKMTDNKHNSVVKSDIASETNIESRVSRESLADINTINIKSHAKENFKSDAVLEATAKRKPGHENEAADLFPAGKNQADAVLNSDVAQEEISYSRPGQQNKIDPNETKVISQPETDLNVGDSYVKDNERIPIQDKIVDPGAGDVNNKSNAPIDEEKEDDIIMLTNAENGNVQQKKDTERPSFFTSLKNVLKKKVKKENRLKLKEYPDTQVKTQVYEDTILDENKIEKKLEETEEEKAEKVLKEKRFKEIQRRKKAAKEENEWFIQQYEKHVGKSRKRPEIKPQTLVRQIRLRAVARYTPEAFFYCPQWKKKPKDSLFLSWDGPYIPRCECPLKECFCRGDIKFADKELIEPIFSCSFMRGCMTKLRPILNLVPLIREPKADAKKLYEKLQTRLAEEMELYKHLEKNELLTQVSPAYCFEECYHCDGPNERNSQTTQ